MSAVMTTASQGRMEWRVVPLSQVCAFKPAKSICRKQLADDAEVSFVPMNDLGELVKYFEPQDVRVFGEVVKSYTYFADGDVLCAKITPCFENGKLGVARNLRNGIGFGSSEFVVMRASGEILPEYLYYFLSRDSFREAGARVMSGAVGHKRVPNEYFENLLVPLPPLKEQKRIVAVLDQAFAALDRARAHAEANLADARALFESELQAVFEHCGEGRNRVPFDELCDAITPRAKIKRQDYLEYGAHPVVSQEASLISGYWNDAMALMGLGGPVVVFGDHTCCLKYVDFDFVVGADGTKVLKPKAGISAAYLYFGLRSQPIAEGGYARHFKLLRERSLPDIPFAEQAALASRLFGLEEKCDELARRYEAQLADLATLRQSLLQKAFAGELA